ncbi:hypothetical protein DPMN_099996 [Dreissena polymorpha]|uniref:Uncharacterized protein n=1 Tax=Dreissena polymorpha TaxID=45954 RepID=A0A9D4LGI2_DREPO|nr:hypothetical protein DPMN_099996 [Dreissena polymorpha]
MSSSSKKHDKDDVLSIFESSEGEFSGFECDEPIPSGASKKVKYVVKRVYDKNKSVTIEKSLPINPLGASQSNNNDKNKKVPKSSSGKKKNNDAAVSNGNLVDLDNLNEDSVNKQRSILGLDVFFGQTNSVSVDQTCPCVWDISAQNQFGT